MANSTGLFSNLRVLYANYGGWGSLITSGYFVVSLAVSALCWRLAADERWAVIAQAILPQLAGFSVAAYALFFAVLDERAREALRAPAESLGNRSPLLVLASAVSHAVVIQIAAVLLAIIYTAKPFTASNSDCVSPIVNTVVSALGLFLMIYGCCLVVAAVLSIFRILEIRTRI